MNDQLKRPGLIMLVIAGTLLIACSPQMFSGLSGSPAGNAKTMDTIRIDYGRPLENNQTHSENISTPSNPEIITLSFFDFGTSGIVASGISDPYMDSIEARELAYYRALALAALLMESKVDNVTEAYYRDLSANRLITTQFNSLSRISASIGLDPASISTLDASRTNAGEKIIKIAYRQSHVPASDSLLVQAEVYYSETPLSLGDRIYTYFKITAVLKTLQGVHEAFVWESHLDNGRLEFLSTHRGRIIEFPVRYRYFAAPSAFICNQEPYPDHYQHEDMGYGLWNAYAIALLRSIDLLEKESIDIKAMTDNFGGQAELLTREISSTKSAFRLQSACTYNNRFYLKLEQK